MQTRMRRSVSLALFASLVLLLSLTSCVLSKQAFRRVVSEEKVLQHLLSLPQELSTFPFCIAEKEDNNYLRNTSVTEVEMSPDQYYQWLAERNASALEVELHFSVLKVVSVTERDQVVAMDVRIELEWTDCRMSWLPETFSQVVNISVPPERFRSMNLFIPTVYLREEMNQPASQGSEVQVRLQADGRISLVREYSTQVACDLNLLMYPFDHHACTLTFETQYNSLDVSLDYQQAETVQQESWRLLGRNRYVPNKLWEVVVLPPEKDRRSTCPNFVETVQNEPLHCLVDKQVFRIILARHPTYQVINLFTPAFLCMLVSASIYIIPNGASDKTFLMLCTLLSTFWFAISIYDKMPDTGSSLSWMGIYYFLCISVVSLNCIVCAISTTISSSKVSISPKLRRSVRWLAPILLRDLLVLRKRVKNAANDRRGSKVPEFYHNESSGPCLFNEHDEPCPTPITWLHVAACVDRIYFLILLSFSIGTLLIFVLGGYMQPESNYAMHLNKSDWQYVETQLSMYEDSDILHKVANF